MPATRLPVFATLICTLTAGCAASGSFPSLAPRPEELRGTASAQPAPPPAAVAPDPAVVARATSLVADARGGDAAFRTLLPQTERAIAAAGSAGSENWTQAQQTLSRLEAARSPTTVAAAELDTLARKQVEAAPSIAEAQLGPVGTAIEQVAQLIESQDQILSRLGKALASP